MIEFLEEQGWWWPSYNGRNPFHIDYFFNHQDDMMPAVEQCKQRSVCIQAGGNIGLWPSKLAQHFETVYTFEPHPDLFQCLVRNAPQSNVIKMQALLGDWPGPRGLENNSFSSHFVVDKGNYPIIRIDDLALDDCDAIFLDIEGFEIFALQGAMRTIQKCRPIIQIEDEEMGSRYGFPADAAENFILDLGYSRGEKIGHDRIYRPLRAKMELVQ